MQTSKVAFFPSVDRSQASNPSISANAEVFVIDDDPSIRKALERLIASYGLKVRSFPSAVEFLKSYQPDEPGCLVLDISLPGINGLELQEKLSDMQVNLPIIFITGHGDIPMSVKAMKSGAVDFLPKPFEDKALLDSVMLALAKDCQLRQRENQIRDIEARLAKLTPREKEVLHHLLAGKLNKQIAADLGAVEKTIKVHRARVMKKLSVNSIAELVRLAETAGLKPV